MHMNWTHLKTSTVSFEVLMVAISSQRRLHLTSTKGAIYEHKASHSLIHIHGIKQ